MHPEALRREDAAFQPCILCRLDSSFIDACLTARTDHGELDTRVRQVEQYKFQKLPDFGGPDAVLVKGDLTVAGNVEFQLVRLELRMLFLSVWLSLLQGWTDTFPTGPSES